MKCEHSPHTTHGPFHLGESVRIERQFCRCGAMRMVESDELHKKISSWMELEPSGRSPNTVWTTYS